eukprot:3773566-Amphidinium_carterae.1
MQQSSAPSTWAALWCLLFHNVRGEVPNKSSMVATIVKAAELLDVKVLGPDGNQGFGGHNLRTGGA